MNLLPNLRRVSPPFLLIAAAIAGAVATGAPVAAGAMPVLEDECVYYELPYEQARPVVVFESDALCPVNAAVHDAGIEAAAWPDFDPSDMSQEVAATEAQQEAATWPDFDPSDMSQEVAETKGRQEAALWPDFDSTAIRTDPALDIATNSPRLTQIAAAESESDTALIGGNTHAF